MQEIHGEININKVKLEIQRVEIKKVFSMFLIK